MQSKIDEFKKISALLLTEAGALTDRPSWGALKLLAKTLPNYQIDLFSEFSQSQALLSLLGSAEAGPTRDTNLKLLLNFFLQYPPEHDFINVLAALPESELTNNLLPFVYEPGNIGAVACYILAKTNYSASAMAFQYFLAARVWPKTDLINLSFLARHEDTAAICSTLDTSATEQTSPVTREIFAEFSYILFNRPVKEPLFPDLTPTAKQPGPSLTLENKTAPVCKQPEPGKTFQTPSEVPVRRAQTVSEQPSSALGKNETMSELFKPLLAICVCLICGLIVSSWYYSEPMQFSQPAKKTTKVPQFWTDAVTRQRITPKFLAADKDYRMAELFLTRDKFSEAQSLLEDALAVDSGHLQALFRVGYCRMRLNNYKGAEEAFKKVLSRDPVYEYANLYLARIAVINNDHPTAMACYQAEYAISKTPSPGAEYANYLEQNGHIDKAKEIISDLKKRFPGKEIILSKTTTQAKPLQESKQQ
ncbi:MAG: tetratricopeptide repeat protein [Erysipelotrichia bacterium]|nr:tetratricopeptide repeat protein [Erysipelotrichia bacterium]